ncbi:hypothetical protein AMTRI_Chr11g156220 [Amborella trichopoda]
MAASNVPSKEAGVLGHEGAVLAAHFNGDGNYCLSCGKVLYLNCLSRDLSIWDNPKLCSCGGDRQIFYWDVNSGYDRSVRAWDCRSHSTEPIQVNTLHFFRMCNSICLTNTEILAGEFDELGQPVNCILTSNDSKCVVAKLLQEYKGHTCNSYKMDCCLTNTDAYVTSGSEDGKIFFWDLVDIASSFQAHAYFATSVAPHPESESYKMLH